MWLLPSSVSATPEALRTNCFTAGKSFNAPVLFGGGIEGQGQTHTYIAAINFLLSFYAIDDVIAKNALEIESLKKFLSQAPVQYFEALINKARQCDDVSFEQRAKFILVERPHLSVGKNAYFRKASLLVDLLYLARSAGTLFQLDANTLTLLATTK